MQRGTRMMMVALGVLALVVGLTAPAGAAKPRTMRQAHACAYYMPPEYGRPELSITPEVGRWYAADGSSIPCWDQMYDEFRPRVRGTFRATVRWYVGKRLVRTERRVVRNRGYDHPVLAFRHRGLHQVSRHGWAVGQRRVSARVTMTKKGYRPVRLRVVQFHFPPE